MNKVLAKFPTPQEIAEARTGLRLKIKEAEILAKCAAALDVAAQLASDENILENERERLDGLYVEVKAAHEKRLADLVHMQELQVAEYREHNEALVEQIAQLEAAVLETQEKCAARTHDLTTALQQLETSSASRHREIREALDAAEDAYHRQEAEHKASLSALQAEIAKLVSEKKRILEQYAGV